MNEYEIARKIVRQDKEYSNLVIRVREKNNEQIIYFGGYKVLQIKDNKFEIAENLFKANYTEIEEEDIKKQIEKKQNLLNVPEISKAINFEFSSIKIEAASGFDSKKFKELIDPNDDNKLSNLSRKQKQELLQSCKDGKYKLIFNPPITEINKILSISYEIMYELKKNNYFFIHAPELKIKATPTTSNDIDLIKAIKQGIKNYHGKDSEEKKYQHVFMLNAINNHNLKTFFNLNSKEHLYYFEQEYGITNYNEKRAKKVEPKNKSDYKNGRIDCIFYNVKNNKIENIYLVELKIDSKVIGETNGVYTHLDDIDSLFTFDKENQIKKLKSLIKYRYDNIDNPGSNLDDKCDSKIYFNTVFGYTKEEEKNKILEFMRQARLDGNTNIPYSIKGIESHVRLDEMKTSDKYTIGFYLDSIKEFDKSKNDKIFVDETITLEKI